MTNTTKFFYYKATRDIIGLMIATFFAIVGYFALKVLGSSFVSDVQIVSTCMWAYVLTVIGSILTSAFSIYSRTYSLLTISPEEIVYNCGWLTKHTVTIPAYKIRTCAKSCTILQRACDSMTISITTSGDGSEIHFSDIRNGEYAYELISYLAKNYER